MKKIFLLLIYSAFFNTIVFSQNNLCEGSIPICLDTLNTYPAGVNSGTAQAGADYTCLGSQPNPAWVYFEVENTGPINIYISSNPQVDVDFTLWGPFTDPSSPCVAQLTAANTVDCSYSTAWNETANIPNAQSGQFYILMVTNYSNQPNNISLVQSNAGQPGAGTLNCVLANPILHNGPLCSGDTLALWSSTTFWAYSYYWSGPDGFASTQLTPQIYSVNQSNSGTYFLNIVSGTDTIYIFSVDIEIYPIHDIFLGDDIEVCNNVSVILNAGSGFDSYEWNTSASSQQIMVSSAVMGIGTHPYWVTAVDNNGCVARDTILVKFIDCTGINEANSVEIEVYPNPAGNFLHIILPENFTGNSLVNIYDIEGRVVFEEQSNDNNFIVDVKQLIAGMYVLKVTNNQLVITKRILVK